MTLYISDQEIISLIDLTRLQDNDTEESILHFCNKAITPLGNVAGLCVFPNWLNVVKNKIADKHDIKLVTVANFPSGNLALVDIIDSIKLAIKHGAQEIDVVIPYKEYIANNHQTTLVLLNKCRDICKPPIILKAILETGELQQKEIIQNACLDAINCHVDFIKTSTGKTKIGATKNAVSAISEVVYSVNPNVGIKLSGGIKEKKEVITYLNMISSKLDVAYINKNTCRIGASSLLDNILNDIC